MQRKQKNIVRAIAMVGVLAIALGAILPAFT